jgi:hypothetical protein
MTGLAEAFRASTIRLLNITVFSGYGIVATAIISAGTESEESSANMSSIALISASPGLIGISK